MFKILMGQTFGRGSGAAGSIASVAISVSQASLFQCGIEACVPCLWRAYGLACCAWRGRFRACVWSVVVATPLARVKPV
jgi:hypothetical protein